MILNTNLIKQKSKIGYPKDSIRDILIGNPQAYRYTIFNTNGESLKVLYTHPKSLGITLDTFHFPETMQVFSNPTPTPRIASTPNRAKTNHNWLKHQQTLNTNTHTHTHTQTHTKLSHLACRRSVGGRLPNPRGSKKKS